MRVLVVEDNKQLARALRQALEEEGFAVDTAHDGEEADVKVKNTDYDVVVLDVMLPKTDGMTLLGQWRASGRKSCVLMLTAKDSLQDKVSGLNLGADDYMTKPFELDELLARVKSGGTAITLFRVPSLSKAKKRAARKSSRLRSVVGEPWAKNVGMGDVKRENGDSRENRCILHCFSVMMQPPSLWT